MEASRGIGNRHWLFSSQDPFLGESYTTEITEQQNEQGKLWTLYLERPDGLTFAPGQYFETCVFNIPIPIVIASGQTEKRLAVTFSNLFMDPSLMGIGQAFSFEGPLGTGFPLDLVNSHTQLLLLSAGSGITPIRSVIHSLEESTNMRLFHSAKTKAGLPYLDELVALRKKGHKICLTQEKADGFDEGRVPQHLQEVKISGDTLAFLCGPEAFLSACIKKLIELGLPKNRIFVSLPIVNKHDGPVFEATHHKVQELLSLQ